MAVSTPVFFVYLDSFSDSPHTSPFPFSCGNGLKLQILGDRSEEWAFDILKRDLLWRRGANLFSKSHFLPTLEILCIS